MPLLEVSQLHKRYGLSVVLDELSFDVDGGEIFGLLGPNGAGKSTTMRTIVGLTDADRGTVLLDGKPLSRREPRRFRELGYVPQDLAIYPDLTASENLQFFGRLYDIPRRQLSLRVAEVLELTGLGGRAHQKSGTFSGGMKRRLNFGIGILHRPRLLILDEPTVGVDPQSRAHLMSCVRQLSESGVGVIYASHYLEEVESICGRLSIIDHGRTLLSGRTSELCRSRPQTIKVTVKHGTELNPERLPSQSRCHAVPDSDLLSIEIPVVVSDCHSAKKVANTYQSSDRENDLDESGLLETVSALLSLIRESGAELQAIQTTQPNLEQLFLSLTGRTLRDGQ